LAGFLDAKSIAMQRAFAQHSDVHGPALNHDSGLQPINLIIKDTRPDLLVSKRKFRQTETIQLVRENRETDRQNLGFSSRPFVLCGLPLKRPAPGCLLHERRNGQFVLQVTGHPSYGLPWGQDRLIAIFLATVAVRQQSPRITFHSAAEMLDAFGLQQGGSQYRRLVASFQRIFGATIFFGTDNQLERAAVVHRARFNFMTEARIWYSRNPEEKLLGGECQNMILLSDEFYREVLDHPIPTDLEAAKALSSCPAALDLFMWLSYRCFTARGKERVPLFGAFGFVSQLGNAEYARPRKFREKLQGWLDIIRAMWPACPAFIDRDGTRLVLDRAYAVLPSRTRETSINCVGSQFKESPTEAIREPE
jgi:hypothetical protein